MALSGPRAAGPQMVESIFFFALGFLAASLLALAFLRGVWSRAVRLTATRLAARLPVSPAIIAADRDRMRASHAIEIRRLERRLETGGAAAGPETVSAQDKAAIRRLTAELAESRTRLGAFETERRAGRQEVVRSPTSPIRETIWAGARATGDFARGLAARVGSGSATADAASGAKVAALEAEVHSLLAIVGNLESELARRTEALAAEPQPPAITALEPSLVEKSANELVPAPILPVPSPIVSTGPSDEELMLALAEQAAELEQKLETERASLDAYKVEIERLNAELVARDIALTEAAEAASRQADSEDGESEKLRAELENVAAELATTLEMLRTERAGFESTAESAKADRARLQQRAAELEQRTGELQQRNAELEVLAAERRAEELAENRALREQLLALAEVITGEAPSPVGAVAPPAPPQATTAKAAASEEMSEAAGEPPGTDPAEARAAKRRTRRKPADAVSAEP